MPHLTKRYGNQSSARCLPPMLQRRTMERIARAVGTSDAALGACRLASENGPRVALRDLGMTQADPDRAADIVCRNP